jgi:hypothetical protein
LRHALAIFTTLTAAFATTCGSEQPGPPRGSPVLLEVHWVAGGKDTVVYARNGDAAAPGSVPGGVSRIDFVFDRRLDGNRVEDTVNGLPATKANPPITVSWPDSASVMSSPPFSADVLYNSVSAYGGESSYVFVRPATPGLPSGTTVTFHLDRTALANVYGEPMDGPEQIEVSIGPMAILRRVGSTPDALEAFPPSYMFRVDFDNRPAASALLVPFARVTSGGAPLPFALAGDSRSPTSIYVSPGACLTGWPTAAVVDVSFEAGLPDAFGVATPAAQTAGSFLVGGAAADAGLPDASCD